MSTPATLLNQVITAAQAAGMGQAALARSAGLAPETISRAKKRGTIDLASIEALANAAGLTLALAPLSPPSEVATAQPPARSPLADPKWGLAWSNSAASNEALIRNALAKGSMVILMEAVKAHGLAEVLEQWVATQATLKPSARAEVERKLKHIQEAFTNAPA